MIHFLVFASAQTSNQSITHIYTHAHQKDIRTRTRDACTRTHARTHAHRMHARIHTHTQTACAANARTHGPMLTPAQPPTPALTPKLTP